MIGFNHGALCDSYEQQANEQGYTLGEDKKLLEDLGFSITFCWIHRLLTDSQYDSALRKLQKELIKALKPLKEDDND